MNSTEICNLALSILKASPINNLESNDPKANLCKRWYGLKKQNLLSKHNWSFAIKKLFLPKNNEGNFLLPGDLIKVLKYSNENIKQMGDEIISSADNLELYYISDVNESLFTSEFINVFSMLMAYTLSFELIGDRVLSNSLKQEYLRLLSTINVDNPLKRKKIKSNFLLHRYG